MFERKAIDVFHDDVMPVFFLADVVDGDDVGVGEVGGGVGFALEAHQKAFVAGQAFVEHFDGHDAPQFQILGAVNGGHAAAADAFQEPVTAVECS
ncbi:MAG: hypothetical protein IPH82_26510 [Chloroflexi bacterium]|nr:hypothetical protein [Chloroflexota bacterium]